MDRGAWWATVLGVAKSQTRLKRFRTHSRAGRRKEDMKHAGVLYFDQDTHVKWMLDLLVIFKCDGDRTGKWNL